MKRLRRLCEATRLISSSAQITLHGVPDRDDLWVVRVTVGQVILVETSAGLLDKVLVEASKKLQSLSQRVLMAVAPDGNGDEDGPDDSVIPPPPATPKVPTPKKP